MDGKAYPAAAVAKDDRVGAVEWISVKVALEVEMLGEFSAAQVPRPQPKNDGGDPRQEAGDGGHREILTHGAVAPRPGFARRRLGFCE